MDAEVLPIGDGGHLTGCGACGVDPWFPGRVEHDERAQVAGGRRAVEQDEVADRRVGSHDLPPSQSVDRALDRQVQDLEIAGEIPPDRAEEVASVLARSLFDLAAEVHNHDRGDADQADRQDYAGCQRPSLGARHEISAHNLSNLDRQANGE